MVLYITAMLGIAIPVYFVQFILLFGLGTETEVCVHILLMSVTVSSSLGSLSAHTY